MQSLSCVQALSQSTESPVVPTCIQHVRFDEECVLIPEPSPVSKIPRLVTKSYSVPLWKRRGQEPSSISDIDVDAKVGEHVVLKVSVPSLAIKSRSPTRSDAHCQPLVPCIINHDPTSPVLHPRPVRQASMSSPRLDVETIPLRPCCPNCFPTTEDSLRQGAEWQEHFTRAARRLRSSSVDSRDNFPARRRLIDAMPGFDSVVAVDEVDKMCRAREVKSYSVVPISERGGDLLLPSLSRKSGPAESTVTAGRPLSWDDSVLPAHHLLPPSPITPSPPTTPRDQEDEMIYHEHASESESPTDPHLNIFSFPEDELSLVNLTYPLRRNRVKTRLAQSVDSTPFRAYLPPPEHLSASSPPAAADSPDFAFADITSRPLVDSLHRASSSTRRRPHLTLPGPGSFLKVSAGILKGVSMSSGAPLSV